MKQSARNHIGVEVIMKHETSADLTWAELYSKKIRSELTLLSAALRKSLTTPEAADSAARLREHLQRAHRTLDDL